MARVQIFWDPGGFELDSLGEKQYLMTSDGDTPFISVSIRMLSIDTPELHYPGNSKPSNQNANFQQLAEWIRMGKAPITDGLAAHLHPRLVTGMAGTLHEQQGEAAKTYFQDLLTQRLTRPNGTMRRVFVHTADTKFDQYGRLLAYMSPYYTKTELQTLTLKDRATFNLLMIESGWAASFVIYPSLPKYFDLVLLHQAAQDAFESARGGWADALRLTGYEFRMCCKLFDLVRKMETGEKINASDKNWVERFCADMTTKAIFYPEEYYRVPPYNRIFIWSQDVNDAVGKLGLVPGM